MNKKLVSPEKVLEVAKSFQVKFTSDQDLIVACLHAIMIINEFVLVGLGESENFAEKNQLPPEWNQSQESWSFRYKHSKASDTCLLKFLKMGSKLLIHAFVKDKEDQIFSMEISTSEYTNSQINNYDNISEKCKNLGKLIDDFNIEISKKILIDITFERNLDKNIPKQQPQKVDPLLVRPERRGVPGYQDGFIDPLLISPGSGDLWGVGGGFGYIPGNLPGTPGGNYVGPNHPIFGIPGVGGRGGIPGGPGQPRFDPYGPVPNHGGKPRPDHFRPPDWRGDFDPYG